MSLSKAVRNALANDGIGAAMDECARRLLPDQGRVKAGGAGLSALNDDSGRLFRRSRMTYRRSGG